MKVNLPNGEIKSGERVGDKTWVLFMRWALGVLFTLCMFFAGGWISTVQARMVVIDSVTTRNDNRVACLETITSIMMGDMKEMKSDIKTILRRTKK